MTDAGGREERRCRGSRGGGVRRSEGKLAGGGTGVRVIGGDGTAEGR